MNKAVVIFVLGQVQNLMLPGLVSKVHGAGAVFIFSVYPVADIPGATIIKIKPSGIVDFFRMVFAVLRASKKLKKFDLIDLYSPHLLNFVANKVYYSNFGRVNLYYLFDGILNYRDVSASLGWAKKYQFRQVFKSVAILHRYIMLKGEMVDQDIPGLKGMMVPQGVLEDRLKFEKPVWSVDINVGAFNENGGVLVLEPPSTGLFFAEFQEKLFDIIKSRYQGREIFIKLHPSKINSGLDISGLEKDGFSVSYINDISPAEKVFSELGCGAVVSTSSSALLLIKSIYPDSDVISILDGAEAEDSTLSGVLEIMKYNGIILV